MDNGYAYQLLESAEVICVSLSSNHSSFKHIEETEKEKEAKILCPKCGAEAKQFEIPKEYRQHEARGRYYCNRCGWLEDSSVPHPSLIKNASLK